MEDMAVTTFKIQPKSSSGQWKAVFTNNYFAPPYIL